MIVTSYNAEQVVDSLQKLMQGKMNLRSLRRHFDREAPLGQVKIMFGTGNQLTDYRMRQLKALVAHRAEVVKHEHRGVKLLGVSKDAANSRFVLNLMLVENPATATRGEYVDALYSLLDTIKCIGMHRIDFDWTEAMVARQQTITMDKRRAERHRAEAAYHSLQA